MQYRVRFQVGWGNKNKEHVLIVEAKSPKDAWNQVRQMNIGGMTYCLEVKAVNPISN